MRRFAMLNCVSQTRFLIKGNLINLEPFLNSLFGFDAFGTKQEIIGYFLDIFPSIGRVTHWCFFCSIETKNTLREEKKR